MEKMNKLLFFLLFFISMAASKYAYGEDNLLAVDVIDNKAKLQAQPAKVIQENKAVKTPQYLAEEPQPNDALDNTLGKIKAYHELLDNKQKELEMIKLDLEKSDLLLKEKEAEKKIFDIDKDLPQGKKDTTLESASSEGAKPASIDSSDMKLQLLVIADNFKEGQITLKGTSYVFKEKDCIASKLIVEQIDSSGVTFKEQDGTVLKLNFIN